MQSNLTKVALTLCTFVWGVLGSVGVLPAGLAIMIFDAPGSDERWWNWVLFWSVFTFPAVCLLAIVLAWVVHGRKHAALAFAAMLLPLINVAIVMLWIATTDGKFTG